MILSYLINAGIFTWLVVVPTRLIVMLSGYASSRPYRPKFYKRSDANIRKVLNTSCILAHILVDGVSVYIRDNTISLKT